MPNDSHRESDRVRALEALVEEQARRLQKLARTEAEFRAMLDRMMLWKPAARLELIAA